MNIYIARFIDMRDAGTEIMGDSGSLCIMAVISGVGVRAASVGCRRESVERLQRSDRLLWTDYRAGSVPKAVRKVERRLLPS